MKSFSSTIMAVLLAAALEQVSFAAPAPSPSYVIEEPASKQLIYTECRVTPAHMTSQCKGIATLEGLNRDPRELPGAPMGREIGVITHARPAIPARAPAHPQRTITMQEAIRRHYPPELLMQEFEVDVAAHCRIADDGRIDLCWLSASEPMAHIGFGKATAAVLSGVRFRSPLPRNRWQTIRIPWRMQGPPPQVIVTCRITRQFRTADCTTPPDRKYPGAARAVLDALAKRPLHLADAPAGRRIDIALLRAELGRASTIAGKGRATDYRPRMITRLSNVIPNIFPVMSDERRVDGDTLSVCKVTDEGHLNECWLAAESSHEATLRIKHLRLTQVVWLPRPTTQSPPYDQRIYRFRISWRFDVGAHSAR